MQYKVVESGIKERYTYFGKIVMDWDAVEELDYDLDEDDITTYGANLETIKQCQPKQYETEYYLTDIPKTIFVVVEMEDNGNIETHKYELDVTNVWDETMSNFIKLYIGCSLKNLLYTNDEIELPPTYAGVKDILYGYDTGHAYCRSIPVWCGDPIRLFVLRKQTTPADFCETIEYFKVTLEGDGWKELW